MMSVSLQVSSAFCCSQFGLFSAGYCKQWKWQLTTLVAALQRSKEGGMVPNQTPIVIEVSFLAFPVCRSDSSSCASGGLQGARRHTTHYPNQPSRDITFFFCFCCCCCCCFALPVCSPYLSLKRLGDQRDYGMGREASSQDQRRRRSGNNNNNNNNNKGGGFVC
jgi:hypothetical protein